MNYRNRLIEKKLKDYFKAFPAILLTGARQTGKSTLLSHLFASDARHVVFDPVIDIENARSDPELFLKENPPPLILDEIQYAPELLTVIKRRLDRDSSPGQYLLTGSQNMAVLEDISESLAGRVIVLDLWNLSLDEQYGKTESGQNNGASWMIGKAELPHNSNLQSPTDTSLLLYRELWRGGYPCLLDREDRLVYDILESYVRTYVERDIRMLSDVSDSHLFSRFFMLCSSLTAQEINFSQLGRELGISPQTAQRWINILKSTYQWIEIPPYHGNTIKRISGKPKGIITDSGLACYLQRVSSHQALSGHPGLGHLFESYVLMEMIKKYSSSGSGFTPNMYHWRTYAGAEVDLVLENDGVFRTVEIKCASRVSRADIRGIRSFRETYPNINHGPGFVVYAGERLEKITEDIYCVPWQML